MFRLAPSIPRDAIILGAMALVGALELAALQPEGWGLGVVAEFIACLLLVWRRTQTLVACTAVALVLVAMP